MTGFSYLSTYPPTRCGLATFTAALATAMATPSDGNARIVRMMDDLARPAVAAVGTHSRIVGELGSASPASPAAIAAAARALNGSGIAIVQHEYGIFGGPDGDDVLRVMELLRVPSIVVLHTVLDAPTLGQRRVLDRVGELADAVVVMTRSARTRLADHSSVDPRIVTVIPHGVATWTAAASRPAPTTRRILTWGLIGPGKGIEHGIRAMAALREVAPDLRYTVSGQTHPRVLAHEGERYRDGLQTLIDELGLGDAVTLENDYLDPERLAERVRDADAVLLPYDSTTQVTSGVLVEAIAAGKPVIATAFPHAVELLGDRTGVVVAHRDPTAMAAGIETVLDWIRSGDHVVRASGPGWGEVAERYRALASDLLDRVEVSA